MSNSYYFAPSGFGIWYQLGVYEKIKDEDNFLYGSSSGSLICLISLLKEKDYNFCKLINIAKDIKNSSNLNLYDYTSKFTSEIIKIISSYDDEYINKKLNRINIEVTLIKFNPIPSLKSIFFKPKDLNDLRNLVHASCYVPLISYYKNIFYYKYNNLIMIDGFFGNFSNINNSIIKINSYKYATIIPCDENDAINKYKEGNKYNFNQPNSNFSIYLLLLISRNIIFDSLIILFNYFKNLLNKLKFNYKEYNS